MSRKHNDKTISRKSSQGDQARKTRGIGVIPDSDVERSHSILAAARSTLSVPEALAMPVLGNADTTTTANLGQTGEDLQRPADTR